MKRYLRKREGGALAMVLIVMAVLSILGTAVLRIAVAESNFAKHNENKLQAHYIARSGAVAVAEHMILQGEIPDGFIGNESAPNDSIGGGQFTVRIDKDSDDKIIITAESNFRGSK